MEKLKKNTKYDFNENDYLFMRELMKVGYVHTLSSQVSLLSRDKVIEFKEFGDTESLRTNGLVLPENWCIEYIGSADNFLKITFGVSKVNAAAKG